MRTATRTAGVLLAALVLAACGGGGDVAPTVAPSLPTALPTSLGTRLSEGTAHVELTGGVEVTYDVDLSPQTSILNEAGVALSFADRSGNAFGVAGVLVAGETKATSTNDLVVTITSATPEINLFISQSGECTVQVDQADDEGVRGSFECSDLAAAQGAPTVDATGTFEASV